jgi:hypothetical protein
MTKTKTQRLKYHVSIPELLDTVERDSVTASLCWNDMDTRMRLGESQSSVEESELALRCRNARERVSQARKDMLTLFDETQDVHLACYRALKAERDDLLAALESIASRPYVDDWMKTIACEAVAKAKAGGAK